MAEARFQKSELVTKSAVDLDVSSKFGAQIELNVYGEVPSIQSTLEVDFRLYNRHLCEFNLVGRCKTAI